ncbi:hypothetical protein [Pseudomonas sp. IT-P218]|uniref:hypothetical protein n=1 Tax=Pseudomonas sp. IT-P218 TaxID=3026449 RepID=UPI0039E1BF2D
MRNWIRSCCDAFVSFCKKWAFVIIGIEIIVVSILMVWGGALKAQALTPADCIQVVIMVFIAGTMFVGIKSHNHEKEYSQSATNLESALSLIERAAQVLVVDGKLTNDRVAWVTCARLIARAEVLGQKVTTETHTLIFESERDFQRHKFRDMLKIGGEELKGSFFCGGDQSQTIGGVVSGFDHPEGGRSWIPTRIINVVYTFMSFPENYEDPLRSSEDFGAKERNRLYQLGHEGVREYLVFRKIFLIIGKKVLKKSDKKGEPLSAEAIDDVIAADMLMLELEE